MVLDAEAEQGTYPSWLRSANPPPHGEGATKAHMRGAGRRAASNRRLAPLGSSCTSRTNRLPECTRTLGSCRAYRCNRSHPSGNRATGHHSRNCSYTPEDSGRSRSRRRLPTFRLGNGSRPATGSRKDRHSARRVRRRRCLPAGPLDTQRAPRSCRLGRSTHRWPRSTRRSRPGSSIRQRHPCSSCRQRPDHSPIPHRTRRRGARRPPRRSGCRLTSTFARA